MRFLHSAPGTAAAARPLPRSWVGSLLLTVGGLFVGALLIRLAWTFALGPNEITWDGAEYVRAAQNVHAGLGYLGLHGVPLYVFPPLYSLVIAALMFLGVHSVAAATAVSVIAGAALVLPAYGAATLVYGRRTGLFAGTIAATLPFAVDLSTIALSDALFITLAASAVYLELRTLRSTRWWDAALAGACFGLAYLTRPEGLVLAAAACVAIVLAALLQPTQRWALARCLPALVLPLALLGAPYVTFLSLHAHHLRLEGKSEINFEIAAGMRRGLTYTQAADALDAQGRAIGPELDRDYYFQSPQFQAPGLVTQITLALGDARRHLIDVPRVLASRGYGWPVLLALAVLGFAGGRWQRRRVVDEIALWGFAAAEFAALSTVFHFWARYADVFIVVLAIWGGHGLELVRAGWERVAARRHWPQLAAPQLAAFAACCLIALTISMRTGFRDNENDSQTLTERQAGEWIAADVPQPGLIFSVSDQSVFYGGGNWTMLPAASQPSLVLHYIRTVGPHLIVLDREQADGRPYILDWLDHGIPAPQAHLLHTIGDPHRPTAAIYRWG